MARPAQRLATDFSTIVSPLEIHETSYDHVVFVTVGSLHPDSRQDVIFAAVLSYFQQKGLARKVSKPPRWTVSRNVLDASAPTSEQRYEFLETNNRLLADHFDMMVFYAHDDAPAGCPQCQRGRCLAQPTSKSSLPDLMLRYRDGKTEILY